MGSPAAAECWAPSSSKVTLMNASSRSLGLSGGWALWAMTSECEGNVVGDGCELQSDACVSDACPYIFTQR